MIPFLATIIFVFLFQVLFYSWWWIILIPAVLGFLQRDSVFQASISTGLGVFCLWMGMSFYHWYHGGEIIVSRVNQVLGVNAGFSLALITAFLGLFTAAVAGYAGFSLRKTLGKEYQIS